VASILSKKLAAGSTHLVIDVPVGPTAKIRSHADAIRLRKLFEYVGENIGLHLDVIVTDGSQPVGRGVGPLLEARDAMRVLERADGAPSDLQERAILLAGSVLEFDPALRGGRGTRRARELLDDGSALAAMRRIVEAQGPGPAEVTLGPLTHDVIAPADGVVDGIDCYRIARIARLAGAPADKGAGIDLFKAIGDPTDAGEPLYRIHAAFPADFRFAKDLATADSGYRVGRRSKP
jgi:thymidine phosphorylase